MPNDKIPAELIKLANSVPELQSLLYDLDLLPEQLLAHGTDPASLNWISAYNKFVLISSHFDALIKRMESGFLDFNETLKNSTIDLSERSFKLLLAEMQLNHQGITQNEQEWAAATKSGIEPEAHRQFSERRKELEDRAVILRAVFDDFIHNGTDIILSRLTR